MIRSTTKAGTVAGAVRRRSRSTLKLQGMNQGVPMASLRRWVDRIERRLANGSCVACATARRVYLIRTTDDQAEFERWMTWHRDHCTCRMRLRVKRIILASQFSDHARIQSHRTGLQYLSDH